MQNLSANVVNKLEKDSLGVEFVALVVESSVMNSSVKTLIETMNSSVNVMNASVKALTEAMISRLKQTQDAMQHQSKQDGMKTIASNTPDGKTCMELPVASLSPCTKKHGWQKGDGSCEIGPLVSERTCSKNKPQSQIHSKEIVKPRSPPRGNVRLQAISTINVTSSFTEDDEGATILEQMRHGSTSPGSDGIFAPARLKVMAPQKPRKRATSNARGETLAKERTLSAKNEAGKEVAMGKTIFPSKMVCIDW